MQSVYSTSPVDRATGLSLGRGGSFLLQICSRCILHPQLTGQQDSRWEEGVLSFCRDAVGVFYIPSRPGNRTLVGKRGFFPSAEMQSVYSTSPVDRATGLSLGRGGSFLLQRCSRCILHPQSTGQQDSRWEEGVLSFCRDAVGVFYIPSRLGNRTLVGKRGFFPSAEMQSVYSTSPVDWATGLSLERGGSFLLQRCSRCIL